MSNNFGLTYNCLGFFGLLTLSLLFSLAAAGSFIVRSIGVDLKNDTIIDITFAYAIMFFILLSSVLPFTFYFLIHIIHDISNMIYNDAVEKVTNEMSEGHIQLEEVETE